MFSPLPYTLLFSSTLILGTMMSLSSSNWIMIWMGLELNLLSFIPMMMNPSMNQESEATMKYFLTQAPASMTMIISMMLYSTQKENILPDMLIMTMLTLSLLMKLGMTPCHWWFPMVASKLSWTMNLILMTWQKLAPILLLMILTMNLTNNLIYFSILLGAFTGGMMGLNQTNIRPLLAYSSISHMSWMLTANILSLSTATFYLIIYLIMTSSLIMLIKLNFTNSSKTLMSWYNTNPKTTIPMTILLMSMGGLPPLLGFLPKLLTFELMMTVNMMALTTFLLLGTLLNLSYYMNIAFNFYAHPHSMKTSNQPTTANMVLTMMATSPIIIFPMTMYAMTIFHKP